MASIRKVEGDLPKWLTDFLETKPGKVIGIVFCILAVGGVGYLLYDAVLGPDSTTRLSSGRVFIDATTGKPFNYTLKVGDTFPIQAPSGGKTGYPTEACFWTADGKVKEEPTYVLLNATVGKKGPTFCPDCHRLVVANNPPAMAGDKPPPTEAESKARR